MGDYLTTYFCYHIGIAVKDDTNACNKSYLLGIDFPQRKLSRVDWPSVGRNPSEDTLKQGEQWRFFKKNQGGAPVLNLPSSHCAQYNEIEGLLISHQTLLLPSDLYKLNLPTLARNCRLAGTWGVGCPLAAPNNRHWGEGGEM